MAKVYYNRTALIGGASNALDSIDGGNLNDGDIAVVRTTDNFVYWYHLVESSGATEASPNVIAPDTNPDSKRWILLGTLGTHAPYNSTMSGHETFAPTWPAGRICFLDPNGADRNFNPSGTFSAGHHLTIINTGSSYNIIFDSTGLGLVVTPGSKAIIHYSGSAWV